jgi:hypothetical protein
MCEIITILVFKNNSRVEFFVIHNVRVWRTYENTATSSTDGCERSIASSSAGATYYTCDELRFNYQYIFKIKVSSFMIYTLTGGHC